MKRIYEKWVRGVMISRDEVDDGIPTLAELRNRITALEAKQVPTIAKASGSIVKENLWDKVKRALGAQSE